MNAALHACREHPEVADNWQTLGTLQLLANDAIGARTSFTRLHSIRPDAVSLYLLGRACMVQGALTEATGFLERARAQDPGSSEIAGAIGTCYLRQGRKSDAKLQFEFAISVDPDSEEAGVGLARLAAADGDFITGIELCNGVIRSGAIDPLSPVLTMAECFLAIGALTQAETAYQVAVNLAPDDPVILANLGQIHSLLGDNARAETELTRALSLNGKCTEANLAMGNVWLAREEFGKARGFFEAALASAPSSVATHSSLAATWLALTRLDRARVVAQAGLSIAPEDHACLLVLAQVEELQGHFAQSETLARRATIANPHNYRGYVLLARAQIALERQAEDVTPNLNRAEEHAPPGNAQDGIRRMKDAYVRAMSRR
jgi:tetratricopeptide (TPR) repeat protein